MIRGKKILSLALALILLVSAAPVRAAGGAALPTAATAETTQQTGGRFAMPALELPAKQAILIEQETGQVLYEKNPDDRVPIASITKIMTLLLTFEALEDGTLTPGQMITASEHAASMGGTQIWLEPGEEMALEDLIEATAVNSANDAAMALANVGDVSEPVRSEYGIHIIKYVSDAVEGEVGLDAVRDALETEVLTQKQDEAYNAAVEAWVEEADAKIYKDRMN